jgi:hypothetical protein
MQRTDELIMDKFTKQILNWCKMHPSPESAYHMRKRNAGQDRWKWTSYDNVYVYII